MLEGRANVWVLRNIDDARQLRDVLLGRPRLAIVGAGFIGPGVAATARRLGAEVTLIEGAPPTGGSPRPTAWNVVLATASGRGRRVDRQRDGRAGGRERRGPRVASVRWPRCSNRLCGRWNRRRPRHRMARRQRPDRCRRRARRSQRRDRSQERVRRHPTRQGKAWWPACAERPRSGRWPGTLLTGALPNS
jgi:glycine/D-amino acid oxidase-like deaminating enzyme